MKKRVAAGIALGVVLLSVLTVSVFMTDWDNMNDSPENIPYDGDVVDEDGNIDTSSLNYNLLEKYGPLLIVLAILMFGAMIGGVCVAREEVENDDSN